MDDERGVGLPRVLPSDHHYDGLFVIDILFFLFVSLLVSLFMRFVLKDGWITDA